MPFSLTYGMQTGTARHHLDRAEDTLASHRLLSRAGADWIVIRRDGEILSLLRLEALAAAEYGERARRSGLVQPTSNNKKGRPLPKPARSDLGGR
jgi:hypothetical protein